MNLRVATLRIYWRHAKQYKKQIATIYPLMVIAQFLEDFLSPLIVSTILTDLSAGTTDYLQDRRLWYIFIAIALLEIIPHLLWNIIVRVYWKTQEMIMRDMSMTIFAHLQTMSLRFFSDRFAGSLVNQANKFVGAFERLTDALTWNVFKLLVSLILTTIILAPRAPLVALSIVVIAAIYTPVTWYFRRKQLPFTVAHAKSETKRTGHLADSISNIFVVKAFSNERREKIMMKHLVDDVFSKSMSIMRMNMRQELITGLIQRSINITVIVSSVILAVNGQIEIGIIYLSLSYTMAIMRRLWDLNNTFKTLTRVFGDANDIAEIMQLQPDITDQIDPEKLQIANSSIEFNNVDFHYGDKKLNNDLFSSLSLSIKAGEKIGLVGPSGGGKSTITKLLMRFMDIQGGTITIGDQDISRVSQHDLRSLISYVPQEPLLFHRTISENISYGRPNATHSEIIEASKKAHAHEFISKLRDGYDTLVGERGVKLSGGQKQRIAIARAIISNSSIVILDEATSALDSESEVLIQNALWKLMEGKTAIVIAHRLSTIQRMDRIIVLNDGKIVEDGPHSQLIKKKNGQYAKLWKHQSGGFIQG